MKKSILILSLSLLIIISCKKNNNNSASTSSPVAVPPKDIQLTATTTSSSINLSWNPVSGCSWYKISKGKQGNTLTEEANYQNLNSNPITYTISNLIPNTIYDIKMEGTDYLSGGKLLATKSITAITTQ